MTQKLSVFGNPLKPDGWKKRQKNRKKYNANEKPKRKKRNGNSGYKSRNKALRKMGYESYREYLASPLWKRIRAAVLNRDGGGCVFCGMEATAVHHEQYDRPTLEGKTYEHLHSACDTCHVKIEFKRGGGKRAFEGVVAATRARRRQFETLEDQHYELDREWMAVSGERLG